jgi:hypothetical protein
MNLRHLRYFINVVDAGSFSRAATVIHVAQPALSQQIAELGRTRGSACCCEPPAGCALPGLARRSAAAAPILRRIRPRLAKIAPQQQQIHHLLHVCGAEAVLRHPHAVDEDDRVRPHIDGGHTLQLFARQAADPQYVIPARAAETIRERFEAMCMLRNEIEIEHGFGDVAHRLVMRFQNQPHDALEGRDIAADADVAILAGDPCLAECRNLDRILRRRNTLERTGVSTPRPLLLLFFLIPFLAVCVVASPRRDADAVLAVTAGMFGVAAMAVQNALVQISLTNTPTTAVRTTNVTHFMLDLGEVLVGRDRARLVHARARAMHTFR